MEEGWIMEIGLYDVSQSAFKFEFRGSSELVDPCKKKRREEKRSEKEGCWKCDVSLSVSLIILFAASMCVKVRESLPSVTLSLTATPPG